MEKTYLFKNYREGSNAKGEYKILELHDPMNLENTTYFLRPEQNINPSIAGVVMKDKVTVVHSITTYNGKPTLTIESIKKAQ